MTQEQIPEDEMPTYPIIDQNSGVVGNPMDADGNPVTPTPEGEEEAPAEEEPKGNRGRSAEAPGRGGDGPPGNRSGEAPGKNKEPKG